HVSPAGVALTPIVGPAWRQRGLAYATLARKGLALRGLFFAAVRNSLLRALSYDASLATKQ
ncbi:MAG: hypothetical protein PVH05_01680, partial [Burkholderiales bacterium]